MTLTVAQLKRTAAAMLTMIDAARRYRAPNPHVIREFQPGTQMILSYDPIGEHHELILRSEHGYPPPADLLIVAAAFGLEIETLLPDQFRRTEVQPTTGRTITWHCLRVAWRETQTGAQPCGNLFAAPCEA